MLRDLLQAEGKVIGRERVTFMMRTMRIEAICRPSEYLGGFNFRSEQLWLA